MTAAVARAPKAVVGRAAPRIAPPTPARSGWKDFHAFAAGIGWELRPWQDTVAKYLTACPTPGGRWTFREVAIIVARQNGKTAIMVPTIVRRLLDGQRIMHTAQNAKLPRDVHDAVATILTEQFRDELPKTRAISYALGNEAIRLRNGAHYRIVPPTKGGARGPANDTVIVDELRELESDDFIAAAKPTITASTRPQIIYLSNAGTDDSVVLNKLRLRSGNDPALAYLEWSAAPGRKADDMAGWLESNPSIGHDPAVLQTLYDDYRADKLSGDLGIFETEHLCRWVPTLREMLVDVGAWNLLKVDDLGQPRRPVMGIALDPEGTRASAAKAWRLPDGSIAGRMLYDVTGDPIDVHRLGEDLRATATSERIVTTGHDPLTDAALAKYLRKTEPIAGAKHANASAAFVNAISGGRLHWHDADAVTDDLTWTSRKPHDESGSFQAVRADDDRPITAALAMIRAVWLASGPGGGQARIW